MHGGLLKIAYSAIHDAVCVAAVTHPDTITTEKAEIRVETVGRWSKGMTVCNFEKMGGLHISEVLKGTGGLPTPCGNATGSPQILRFVSGIDPAASRQ